MPRSLLNDYAYPSLGSHLIILFSGVVHESRVDLRGEACVHVCRTALEAVALPEGLHDRPPLLLLVQALDHLRDWTQDQVEAGGWEDEEEGERHPDDVFAANHFFEENSLLVLKEKVEGDPDAKDKGNTGGIILDQSEFHDKEMSQNGGRGQQECNGLDCEKVSCFEFPIWGLSDRDEDEVSDEDYEVYGDGYWIPDHCISLGQDVLRCRCLIMWYLCCIVRVEQSNQARRGSVQLNICDQTQGEVDIIAHQLKHESDEYKTKANYAATVKILILDFLRVATLGEIRDVMMDERVRYLPQ